jgi:long-subunit acyl-CoA synthetase (AMP-forming)
MCRRDYPPEVIAATSGRAIPGLEVRAVVDGRSVPQGEPGEIVVRGYTVMGGYWQDEAATAAAIDGEGWLHTGDIGVMDAAGNVTITDRVKDMFVVGGFNAYPAEIEATAWPRSRWWGSPTSAWARWVVPSSSRARRGAGLASPARPKAPRNSLMR